MAGEKFIVHFTTKDKVYGTIKSLNDDFSELFMEPLKASMMTSPNCCR